MKYDSFIDLFWASRIFERLKNIDDFKVFCKKHNYVFNKEIFEGYKFLFKIILLKTFLIDLEYNTSLGLNDDKIIQRALSKGVPKEKISPTCEKAIFIKNVDELFKRICESKSEESFKAALKECYNILFLNLNKIFNESIALNKEFKINLDKEKVLDYLSSFYFYHACHNIDSFIPLQDDPLEIMHQRMNKRYKQYIKKELPKIRKLLPGYKLGLFFFWDQFLKDKEINFSHKKILEAQSWEELDKLYSYINENYIVPLEKNWKVDLRFYSFFRKIKRFKKEYLKDLTKIATSPKLKLFEKIDELLLWYDFEIIDSARSKIFSGVSTFTSLLKGEVLTRIEHDIKDKIEVIKFIHEGKPTFFSYALLIERFGSFSDFSGWLIFYDCCGDYAGLGGTEYEEAEGIINSVKDFINLREYKISKQMLKNYFIHSLKNKIGTIGSSLSESEAYRFQVDYLIKRSREKDGWLLHLLSYLYFNNKMHFIKWSYKNKKILGNKEIDIVAAKFKELYIIECSLRLPIIDKEIDALIKEYVAKSEIIRDSNLIREYKKTNKGFVKWDRINKILVIPVKCLESNKAKEAIEKLENNGVNVILFEKEILSKLPRKKRLLNVFL